MLHPLPAADLGIIAATASIAARLTPEARVVETEANGNPAHSTRQLTIDASKRRQAAAQPGHWCPYAVRTSVRK